GEGSIYLKVMHQYYNQREKIEPVKAVVHIAEQAMHNLQITPIIEPIRGGTHGTQLSYKGLPTPNIFTGGMNFHGKYEFISVQDMEKATKTIVDICELFTKKELSKNYHFTALLPCKPRFFYNPEYFPLSSLLQYRGLL